ncbi:MAG: HAD-IA family hydrolase [Bacteroidota bacterium]
MNIDLIIFDLDGTLVNSIPDLTVSLNHVASLNSKSIFNESEVTHLVGGGISNLICKAFNISNNDPKFDIYFNQFMNHHEQSINTHSHLYKNTIEILEYFKTKKLAVLSNKINHLTKQVVVDFKIDSYFTLVLGATNGLAKKPSAEPILYILNKLNIQPSKAIMVGDSEPDIICAKNAGIKTIALTCGYRSKSQLEPLNPDYFINDLIELKSIIQI